MANTFGSKLLQFAQSVDIVQNGTFEELLLATYEYLKKSLEVKHVGVLEHARVNRAVGLRVAWKQLGIDWSVELRTASGEYTGQISFAYDREKALWIVAPGGGLLDATDRYQDLWDPQATAAPDEIPKFAHTNEEPIRTSIILPLKDNQKTFGVLDLESTLHLTPTEMLRNEIVTIAKAISLLYILKQAHVIQVESTRSAKKRLIDEPRPPLLSEYRVFLATPEKSDGAVVEAIKSAVQHARPDSKLVHWPDQNTLGSIPTGMWQDMLHCTVGVCYLSELAEGGDHRFAYNQNVLFEAGVMQGLCIADALQAWIPIRERDSPTLPFDLRTERVLEVPRGQDGEVDAEKLRARLEGALPSGRQ